MEAATLMILGLMAAPTDDKQAHYYAGAAVAQVAQENGLSAWESCGLTLAAAYLLFVLILLFRPQGLLGRRTA